MPYDPTPQIRLAFEGRSPSPDDEWVQRGPKESLASRVRSHYLRCVERDCLFLYIRSYFIQNLLIIEVQKNTQDLTANIQTSENVTELIFY